MKNKVKVLHGKVFGDIGWVEEAPPPHLARSPPRCSSPTPFPLTNCNSETIKGEALRQQTIVGPNQELMSCELQPRNFNGFSISLGGATVQSTEQVFIILGISSNLSPNGTVIEVYEGF